MTTTGTTTTSDGATIAWDRRGAGPPLVLVHGITDNRGSLAGIADRLAATGHEVISMDLRGHGASGAAADYGIERMAADLVEVAAALELERPVLVGHSLGGLVVTAAGPALGAAAIVNIDQGLQIGAMAEVVASLADQLRDPATFHPTLTAFFAAFESPGLDPEVAAEFAAGVASVDQDVVLGVWGPMFDGPDPAVDELIDTILAGVTMPYLAVHGMDPGPDYPEWLRERIPHAEFELHEGAGHFVHLVDEAAFVARVEQFLTTNA